MKSIEIYRNPMKSLVGPYNRISMDKVEFDPQTGLSGETKNTESDLRAQTRYRNSVRQQWGTMYKDDQNKI